MFKRKLPALLGLILIISGAFVGVVFLNQETSFLPRAAPEHEPRQVKVTNITHDRFSVSWITQEPAIGFVKFGTTPDNLDTAVVDDRDQLTGSSEQFRTHHVTITGLNANSQYFFEIGSQGDTLYDENGTPYSAVTGPNLSTAPPTDTANGTVLTPAQTPAEGALVYLTLPNSFPLSTLVKQNGNWAVIISQARSQDLTEYTTYQPSTSYQIEVVDGSNPLTTVQITASNDQPVPEIIIGKNQNYEEVNQANMLDADPTPTSPIENKFTFKTLNVDTTEVSTIAIDTIPTDGFTTTNQQPNIIGTAPAGVVLTISVHSSVVYTDSVTVAADGSWQWIPPGTLEPGSHTLTISYTDTEGILHRLERTFVISAFEVQASEGTPGYTATPSATIAPTNTPVPTLIPTLIPTNQPTAVPTKYISPTPRPTLTASPTPNIRTSVPSTESGIPVAGSTWPSIGLLLAGLCFIGLGTLLVYKVNLS